MNRCDHRCCNCNDTGVIGFPTAPEPCRCGKVDVVAKADAEWRRLQEIDPRFEDEQPHTSSCDSGPNHPGPCR